VAVVDLIIEVAETTEAAEVARTITTVIRTEIMTEIEEVVVVVVAEAAAVDMGLETTIDILDPRRIDSILHKAN
jgi:hypothetical protein